MIENRLQIIIAIILCLLLFTLVRRIVKKTLDIKSTLSWMILIVVLLIVDIFPKILEWAAVFMGIELPSNMIFMVAIIFLSVIVLSHTMVISKLTETNKTLVQEIALLKKQIENMKNK